MKPSAATVYRWELRKLRSQKRTELHGIVQEGYQPCVRVLKPAEERGLRPLG